MTEMGDGFYRGLFREIDEHEDWDYSQSNSYTIEELASRFEADIGPEAVYESASTEGQVLFSLGRDFAVTGRLAQPLADLSMDPGEDTFAAEVGEAYNGIASRHVRDSQYLRQSIPERNPLDVLVMDVPRDYDSGELEMALEAAGTASREIQDLHDDIEHILSERIV